MSLRTVLLVAGAILASARAHAGDVPQYRGDRHMGVATCAGPVCHGATKPGKHAVRQDEYFIWREEGGDLRHSRAFDALHEAASKRIAKNLGLARPAHEEPLCLDCHADNVPAKLRGPKFQMEDGVACEACHGGSERWLKPHDTGSAHAENLKLGMFPTDDPIRRAELCLSCHFGDEKKFVDHRLMGAGHPRQSFEMVIFTDLQGHHDVDSDYEGRGKVVADLLAEWAVGQAVAVREVLEAMLDPKRARTGIWPEFVLFDCHACHHPMSDTRWRPRPSAGLGPGLARLNDANFLMLRQALQVLDPTGAKSFGDDLRALHAATSAGRGDQEAVARRMLKAVNTWIPKLAAWKVGDAAQRQIAKALLGEGAGGEYRDYAGAEQATSILQILIANREQSLSAKTRRQVRALEDQMLANVATPENFDPAPFEKAFQKLKPLLE